MWNNNGPANELGVLMIGIRKLSFLLDLSKNLKPIFFLNVWIPLWY